MRPPGLDFPAAEKMGNLSDTSHLCRFVREDCGTYEKLPMRAGRANQVGTSIRGNMMITFLMSALHGHGVHAMLVYSWQYPRIRRDGSRAHTAGGHGSSQSYAFDSTDAKNNLSSDNEPQTITILVCTKDDGLLCDEPQVCRRHQPRLGAGLWGL